MGTTLRSETHVVHVDLFAAKVKLCRACFERSMGLKVFGGVRIPEVEKSLRDLIKICF
jgi:hypothetical protein